MATPKVNKIQMRLPATLSDHFPITDVACRSLSLPIQDGPYDLSGIIGRRMVISMHLEKSGKNLVGWYKYNSSSGNRINLIGFISDSGAFKIDEYGSTRDVVTGGFTVKFVTARLSEIGSRLTAKKRIRLSFIGKVSDNRRSLNGGLRSRLTKNLMTRHGHDVRTSKGVWTTTRRFVSVIAIVPLDFINSQPNNVGKMMTIAGKIITTIALVVFSRSSCALELSDVFRIPRLAHTLVHRYCRGGTQSSTECGTTIKVKQSPNRR
jgi:hypothetical protein